MRPNLNLGDEQGFALVMALGSLVVLSLILTIALEVSASSGRHAVRSNASQNAYRLAEVGLNNAVAVIAEVGADTARVKPQPAYAGDPASTVTPLNGGTITWGGSYNASTRTWSLKTIGSAVNAAGSAPATHTITAELKLTVPSIAFAALNDTSEKHTLIIRSGGDLTVNNSIYVNTSNGNDGFDVKGDGGSIKGTAIYTHGGWETEDSPGQVRVGGTKCNLPGRQFYAPTTGPGCPVTGTAILADPFASTPLAPTPGAVACPTMTTVAAYSTAQALNAAIANVATTFQSKGGAAIAINDVIEVDSERMRVTALSSAGGGKYDLTVTRAYGGTVAAAHNVDSPILKVTTAAAGTATAPSACTIERGALTLTPGTYYGGICIGASDCDDANCTTATAYAATAYSPAQKLSGAINSSVTSILSNGYAVSAGDVIVIDSERMLVTATFFAGGKETLTVQRGYLGTSAASHSNNADLKNVLIPAQVTLADGTYVMAGGGFRVCGASTLTAPNVMIYNTRDRVGSTTYEDLDQVLLNTTGAVNLGAQPTGPYAGMTIFQDRARTLDSGECDKKSKDPEWEKWDIGFKSMASTGANGALGSVSGTIYAAADRALFVDAVSGTATLAVVTGCIYVDGGNSTFNFQADQLYGNGLTLLSQSG